MNPWLVAWLVAGSLAGSTAWLAWLVATWHDTGDPQWTVPASRTGRRHPDPTRHTRASAHRRPHRVVTPAEENDPTG